MKKGRDEDWSLAGRRRRRTRRMRREDDRRRMGGGGTGKPGRVMWKSDHGHGENENMEEDTWRIEARGRLVTTHEQWHGGIYRACNETSNAPLRHATRIGNWMLNSWYGHFQNILQNPCTQIIYNSKFVLHFHSFLGCWEKARRRARRKGGRQTTTW